MALICTNPNVNTSRSTIGWRFGCGTLSVRPRNLPSTLMPFPELSNLILDTRVSGDGDHIWIFMRNVEGGHSRPKDEAGRQFGNRSPEPPDCCCSVRSFIPWHMGLSETLFGAMAKVMTIDLRYIYLPVHQCATVHPRLFALLVNARCTAAHTLKPYVLCNRL